MSNSLGTRIKELRQLSGLSQEELGRRVGVQRAAINKYEKGTVTNIPITTLEQMANIFEVSPTYLVGWKDDQMPSDLAMEVKILSGVERFYGKEAIYLLEILTKVDKVGKKRLCDYGDEVERLYSKE